MEEKEQEKRVLQHYLTLMMFFSLLIDPDTDEEAIENLTDLRKYLKRGKI